MALNYLCYTLFCIAIFSQKLDCQSIERRDDCDFHVTIIRQLENDGFHREIHSLVELLGGYSIAQRQHCFLALRETLPSGLYVSPDQLEDLARLGQVQACANTSVDVEAPEPVSSNLSVLIYSGLERAENLLSAKLVLPVHARYHAPSEDGGYRPITVGTPELFLRCAGHLQCPELTSLTLPCYTCSEELCTWTQIPYKTNAETLNMLVPVGNMQHYYLVTFLTFTITTGGAVYILLVMVNSAANIYDSG
uniref:Phosphatidylinositol-glycan biosynthesis class X protein n=1 Tax=Cuerna arida TaxID=1464854 RepID=A0A1B6EKN5_9HEMI